MEIIQMVFNSMDKKALRRAYIISFIAFAIFTLGTFNSTLPETKPLIQIFLWEVYLFACALTFPFALRAFFSIFASLFGSLTGVVLWGVSFFVYFFLYFLSIPIGLIQFWLLYKEAVKDRRRW